MDLVTELNGNWADQNTYACQMLLRALIDHIPPVFGQRTFDGVIASGGWGRTHESYLRRLAAFRLSADDILHRHITTRPSRILIHDMPPPAYVRDRIPDAGKKPLHGLIKQGAADGILTARQAEYLDYGRQIRNGMAHGQTTHAVMPPAMAVPMVTTSFAIVSELCAAVLSH
ncbi:hypothetical protein [Streptomyces sp. SID1034]|uniref:hypothetical protein n=1 Tax=Streptomyces sp. SID1034 TaxID=2690248 RepID=UPI001F2DB307|nr:hypothetical protein [Streptomyces sp. SID1034]